MFIPFDKVGIYVCDMLCYVILNATNFSEQSLDDTSSSHLARRLFVELNVFLGVNSSGVLALSGGGVTRRWGRFQGGP